MYKCHQAGRNFRIREFALGLFFRYLISYSVRNTPILQVFGKSQITQKVEGLMRTRDLESF
jgi:hypothetical protein